MSFCPYCGKQVNDGEICSCTTVSAPRPQQNFASAPSATSYPAPPAAPRAGAYSAPKPEAAPVSDPAVPQSGGFVPPQPEAYTAPQPGTYGPQPGVYGPQHGTYGPQPGAYGPQPNGYAPPYGGHSVPRTPSAFSIGVNALMNRIKMLFSANPNEAVRDSLNATDFSWSVVYGVYVLFGSLAASLALACSLGGGIGNVFSGRYGADELFFGTLWRALIVNIFTLGIALGVVMAVTAIFRKPLHITKALNFISFAFVPAAVFNVLGMLFAFFFPAGTMVFGLLSSVCTLAILCIGLADHCKTNNLWLHIGTSSSMITAYVLITYLVMLATINQLFGGLF